MRILRLGLFAVAGLGLAAALIVSCSQPAPPPPSAPPAPDVSPEHGKYLVETHLCNDCHTPAKMGPNGPEPDWSRMLSGHPESVKPPAPPMLKPTGIGDWMFSGLG